MKRVVYLSLIVIVFIIGFSVFGFAKTPDKIETDNSSNTEVEENTTKVRLELIEERALTKDVEMQLAKEMGKRIMISKDKDKRRSDLLFYDKNGKLVHTISGELYKIGYLISQDSKNAGVLYASENSFPEDPRDSLVAYDSLGRRMWGIKQGDDGANLVLNNLRKFHLSAGRRLFLKGDRLVAIQNHMIHIPTYATKDGLKVLFFKDGKKVKEVVVPHPYIWQAGWSPDGKMFVISVPGRSAAGISRNDVIYAYDKNGNKLWRKNIENAHFIPSSFRGVKTFIVTSKYIIQSLSDKIEKKHGIVILDYSGEIKNKVFADCAFYLAISNNENYLVDWERWRVFIIDLKSMKVIGEWSNKKLFKGENALIKDCFFEKENSLIIIKGFKQKKFLRYYIKKM
jgi:hypothetical protein